MEAKLDGRVTAITGGSKGIGRAIAAKMAQCGAEVAMLASNLASYVTGTSINADGKMSPVM